MDQQITCITEIEVDFLAVAKEIVQFVRRSLLDSQEWRVLETMKPLTSEKIEKVINKVDQCFKNKKMGLQELAIFAKKELVIEAMHLSLPKYSGRYLVGDIGALEYFTRFYRKYFIAFGLPANAIGTIDPNLHTQIKKEKIFPKITRSLSLH